ncbi:MAG: hypothetical protein F4X64_07955 [Chloroflexi bacterium]|nr:hypothetical protein [Chloroflexota bacterium]
MAVLINDTTTGHGEGICPITGLTIPDEGYLGTGDKATWGLYSFTLNSFATPDTYTFKLKDGTEQVESPPSGRKWLTVSFDASNSFDFDVSLLDGAYFLLSTDRGNAFGWNPEYDLPPGYKYTDATLAFDVPADAEVAVLALRPLISNTGENAPKLYQMDLTTLE